MLPRKFLISDCCELPSLVILKPKTVLDCSSRPLDLEDESTTATVVHFLLKPAKEKVRAIYFLET